MAASKLCTCRQWPARHAQKKVEGEKHQPFLTIATQASQQRRKRLVGMSTAPALKSYLSYNTQEI